MKNKKIEFLEQKSFNLSVRARKIQNSNKTNYPYISGDAFSKVCDLTFLGNDNKYKSQIKSAQSIFCKSEKLEELIDRYGDLISATVLIFGNSDRDFFNLKCNFPPSVKSVYLQNSHISNHFFHTLPIGIENLRHGRNGQKSLFKGDFLNKEKSQRILVGPFSPTHSERFELDAWKKIKHPRIQAVSEHLRPKNYAALASEFKFIACPRGNGTDTHRFWEALYRGSIPVVKRSKWSQSINQLGIPMLELETWDFEEFLVRSEATAFTRVNPKQIDSLWMSYWEKLLNSDSE